MKIALIGYGAMGQLVAAEARKVDDEVGAVIVTNERGLTVEELAQKLRGHDVVVDFSMAEAVIKNIDASVRANVPLVEGTTGWKNHETDVKRIVSEGGGALVYGANFSIGVNVFYRIVEHASALLSAVDGYVPFIEEEHHM